MADQRAKSAPSPFDETGLDTGRNLRAMEDDGAIDKWIQDEQDYQRRVLADAPKVLNPDQVIAFQKAMEQTMDMQKFGIKMSKEMFTKKGAGTAPAPPAPVVAPAK
jgi:hypothetical protein